MNRLEMKLLCAFVIFILSLVSCLIPFLIFAVNWSKLQRGVVSITKVEDKAAENLNNSLALSCLLCLGGGVFFGAFLLHMLPEVLEIMEASTLSSVEYPLAYLLIGAGFFLVLAVDVLVGACQKRLHKKKQKKEANNFVNPAYVVDYTVVVDKAKEQDEDIESNTAPNHTNHSHTDHIDTDHSHNDHSHTDHNEGDHHHHHHATHSIVLVLALSFHHIFEGMSIGLMNNKEDVWKLTLAVLIHEIVICFSMGLQFYKTDKRLSPKVGVILFIFSFVLPIGVFIGIIITEISHGHTGATQNTISGVLQALSSGSFLYVTFFELLFEQLATHKHIVIKTSWVFIGFVIEALLAIAGHHHDHGDHDHGGHDDHGDHDDHDDHGDHDEAGHDSHDKDYTGVNHDLTTTFHDHHDEIHPAALILRNITRLMS